MNIKEIRELSIIDITNKIKEEQTEIMQLYFKLVNNQLKNNQEIKKRRKIIARFTTVLTMKIKEEFKKEIKENISLN